MDLPRLYAIIDRESLKARGLTAAEFARELREAGVRLVQYRDKSGSPQQILQAAAEIAQAFAGYEATLILNDRADLAALAGWNGVHVGHLDLLPEAARRVLGTGKLIGVSTHNEEQVRAAEASVANYIAVGPVFGTASKRDAEPVIGLEGVRRARALASKPIVAIGGITLENAPNVIEAGADCVAVIGGLFVPDFNAGEVARAFLKRLG